MKGNTANGCQSRSHTIGEYIDVSCRDLIFELLADRWTRYDALGQVS